MADDTTKQFRTKNREFGSNGEGDAFDIVRDAERADFVGNGNGNGSGSGDGGDGFDPSIHVGRDSRNADGSYRKKRGRKSTSTNRKKPHNQAGIEGLTRVLTIVHLGLSAATKCPEIALDDVEADALAQSTANVLNEFDIRPDPKIEAIFGLITTAGMIYGPRIYMIRERIKNEKNERKLK